MFNFVTVLGQFGRKLLKAYRAFKFLVYGLDLNMLWCMLAELSTCHFLYCPTSIHHQNDCMYQELACHSMQTVLSYFFLSYCFIILAIWFATLLLPLALQLLYCYHHHWRSRCIVITTVFWLLHHVSHTLLAHAVVDCGLLPPPSNGQIIITTTTFESQVHFTCDSGFRLEGPAYRRCLATGVWSEFQPKCVGT